MDLVERLNDEAMRLQGRGIDRGCVDSSLAGNLALEAADFIEKQADEIIHLREALRRARPLVSRTRVENFEDQEERALMLKRIDSALQGMRE